jgi:Ca-activated chloride channel family protein
MSLCAAAATARAQQPTPTPAGDEDDEVERVTVHLVSVPVSVTDRDGRFVADLTKEDFRVTDGGVEQRIAYFAAVEQPFSVLLLIDTSGSTQLRLKDIQDSAIAFVNQLRPHDRVLPVAFDNDALALLPEWTSDRARLAAAIRGAQTGMVREENDTKVYKDREGKPLTVRHINTRLYDAVHKAAAVMRRITGRKAIIVFTDGFDSASREATRKSTLDEAEELDSLIYVVQYPRYLSAKEREREKPRDANPADAPKVIERKATVGPGAIGGQGSSPQVPLPAPVPLGGMPVGIVGPPARPFEQRHPVILGVEQYLGGLAEKTGGRYFYASDMERISLAFAAVADELRRMYSIGYHPTPLARPGQRREVKIKVARKGAAVRARRAYVFRPR